MTNHNPNIHNRPYRVVEYDPAWPEQFAQYASQLKKILGDNLLEVHHFGSTAIPGMFAKPNIDIYALVTSLDNVRASCAAMEELGFISRGDYSNIGEEYFTRDTETGERIASVHIFEGTGAIIEGYRNFHDYLLEHKNDRERYITLKRELYEKYKDDYRAYDSGKQVLIEELKAKANRWASMGEG